VDIDVHHGNGTEEIVRAYSDPNKLFFFSIHIYDKDAPASYEFYPGTGQDDELNHNIYNVPLVPLWKDKAPGTRQKSQQANKKQYGRSEFRLQIVQRLLPPLRAFNPDLIMISAGFDAAKDDVGNARNDKHHNRAQGLDLEAEDYTWMTEKILEVADRCSKGRVVSVMEGGYGRLAPRSGKSSGGGVPKKLDRSLLADSVVSHIHTLVDHRRTNYEEREEKDADNEDDEGGEDDGRQENEGSSAPVKSASNGTRKGDRKR